MGTHSGQNRVSLGLVAAFCGAGLALGSCVATNAASAVSSSAVNTMSAVGRAAAQSATAVNRTVAQIPAALMYGPGPSRRIVIPVNRTRPARVAQPRTASRSQAAPPKRSSPERMGARAPKPPAKKSTARAGAFLEVMPPELLDQLSQDQINLQAIVQAEALADDKGETILWDLDGRAGTARTEAPHTLGAFTCRAVIESVKLSETATEARATACRTDATAWTL